METFTFPDGHISFDYFAGWTVTVKPGPANNPEEQKISFEATVKDETGTVLARVYSGKYGDGAAAPAKRTILDHSPVSGITNTAGEATEFGFAYDEYLDGGYYYFMDVRNAREFLATTDTSGSNQITAAQQDHERLGRPDRFAVDAGLHVAGRRESLDGQPDGTPSSKRCCSACATSRLAARRLNHLRAQCWLTALGTAARPMISPKSRLAARLGGVEPR